MPPPAESLPNVERLAEPLPAFLAEPAAPRRAPWVWLSALAALVLVTQILLHFRAEVVAAAPMARAGLEGACGLLGCELRLLGTVHYDRKKQAITRFDAVGVGRAWGRRSAEIRLDRYPWTYGIACELVTGEFWYGTMARHDRRRLAQAVWAVLANRLL